MSKNRTPGLWRRFTKTINWHNEVHTLMSILTSHMMVTKNPQNVHRKYFWEILMTFISDIKIDINMCEPHVNLFLGGLSLHLNHLIASRMGICYRQFGTLPIGIFLSNLDSRQLDTFLMISYGQFCHMSTFGNSRAVWVLLPKYGALRKSKFSWWRSDQWLMRLGGFRWADNWATWWYHFGGGCNTLKGVSGAIGKKIAFFSTFAMP